MYLLIFSFILNDIHLFKLSFLLLDTFQPIGKWLTQISGILKSMSYYILLSLAFVAFFHLFLVLEDSNEHHDNNELSEWEFNINVRSDIIIVIILILITRT